MKSAISVELDGTLFTCDEPAYAALRSYLDRAGARLGSHPDRAEVIAGLERSIAAKLRQRAATQSGITIDEAAMLSALKEVGRVDGPALDGSASSAEGDSSAPPTRKLYRLRQGNWFGGVCFARSRSPPAKDLGQHHQCGAARRRGAHEPRRALEVGFLLGTRRHLYQGGLELGHVCGRLVADGHGGQTERSVLGAHPEARRALFRTGTRAAMLTRRVGEAGSGLDAGSAGHDGTHHQTLR